MKKIAVILVLISSFIIILYFILNGFNTSSNSNSQEEQYSPPVCGNNICEDGEEEYCLECNLSCKSELCNSKINIVCENCTETQKKLLPTLFEHQTIVYDCLAGYYGYNPTRVVYQTITHTDIIRESCDRKEGCYVSDGGFASREGTRQAFMPGLWEYGENDVTKQENVGFMIHELAHVFTHHGLGIVSIWFSEGISIYSESRLFCHLDYILSEKMDSFLISYNRLKTGNATLDEIAPYDEYYKTEHNSHVTGAMYFGALEQDYNCDANCISKILYALHEYKENCTGECFENAKQNLPETMNTSLNINDLRIPIITNKIIKQKSEDIIGKDLTNLFELLEIEY